MAMTLEKKLLRAIAAGNQSVIEAMLLGIFGPDAQLWLAREIVGRPEKEEPATPDCFDREPPWVRH
jgi:hypothetical protein